MWTEESKSVMIHREAAVYSTSVQPDTPPPFRPAGELGDWWPKGLGRDGLRRWGGEGVLRKRNKVWM